MSSTRGTAVIPAETEKELQSSMPAIQMRLIAKLNKPAPVFSAPPTHGKSEYDTSLSHVAALQDVLETKLSLSPTLQEKLYSHRQQCQQLQVECQAEKRAVEDLSLKIAEVSAIYFRDEGQSLQPLENNITRGLLDLSDRFEKINQTCQASAKQLDNLLETVTPGAEKSRSKGFRKK